MYPHGHHHQPHHGRREDEEPYPPPARPPPPPFYNDEPPPPPPQVYHTSHYGPGPDSYAAPPPPTVPNYSNYGQSYPSPPPPVVEPHYNRPHFPPSVHHVSHVNNDEFAGKPSVRMYCKAETNYSLTIRDGKVILSRADPSDPFQHWIKDQKFSTRVKDEEGFPSFALINKATGQALKHAIGATHPVQLISYNPNVLDESILWTESRDLGDSYRAIRMVNNIRLNVDAFNGDKNHGGVHDGTTIVLWEWKKGDNQRWKIVPYFAGV